MQVTKANYFSPEATRAYWSVSQFKSFNKCEACGLAESRGEWVREETSSLLIGSYVDAYFSDELEKFLKENGHKMIKKDGNLKSEFVRANDMIERVEQDQLMMEYLVGAKQTVLTGELFGVPWKAKLDVLTDDRIVDLKAVKDFADVYDPGYGYRSWIEFWGYDIQGAVYQKIEQLVTGRKNPLPFYIVAVTKEKTPDIGIFQIPQHILDASLAMVEAKIERFDMIKNGEVEPIRCGKCDYCKSTKKLTAPEVYEIKEA